MNPTPPIHGRFIKGQSGNPGGKPKYALTRDSFRKIVAKYAGMNSVEIDKAMNDPNTTVIEHSVISGFVKAMKDGDMNRLNFFLERSIGKATESPQELNVNLQQVPNAELIALAKQSIGVLEGEVFDHSNS